MSDPVTELVRQVKAPIARKSIDEKVAVFERRLNGKLLPFAGLHGTLLALIYLVRETPVLRNLWAWHPMAPALALAAAALVCGAFVVAYRYARNASDPAGGAAVAFCLGLLAVLLLPLGGGFEDTTLNYVWATVQFAAAIGLCLALLALNATGRVSDYDFNTVWLYVPLIFLVTIRLPAVEQMIAAVALYGPAIYVKFKRQPESNKMPLGFSALVFLGLIIEDNADAQIMVGAMVVVVLVLFVIYSFRLRHVAGSAYRHFLADTIIMGLWALLVSLMDLDETFSVVLWGLGVVAYQGVTLAMLLIGKPVTARSATERDARLAWLQIGMFAILGQLIIEDLLEQQWGVENSYVGVLIIMSPFIPLFRWLQAPFLALGTRLWIGGTLILIAEEAESILERRFTIPVREGQTFETLRADYLANWPGELIWPALALVIALAATWRITPAYTAAWWRGLIRARHMVLLRRAGRLVAANANRIAFVGGFIAAAVALVKWMRYAGSGDGKDGGGQRSRDVLLLGAHVFAVAITVLFVRYGVGCCDAEAYKALVLSPLEFAQGDLAFVLACCLWGLLLYVRGVLGRDYLARFFATAFVVFPLATFATNNNLDSSAFFAQVVLACGFSLFAFGLLRGMLRGPQRRVIV